MRAIAVMACIGFVVVTSTQVQAQVSGQRILGASCPAGSQVEIQIVIDVDEGAEPSGVIVVETLPPGWTLVSADPAQRSFENQEARWLFFGAEVADQTITYVAAVPSGTTGAQILSGVLRFTVNGEELEEAIEGDSTCQAGGGVPPTATPTRTSEPPTATFTPEPTDPIPTFTPSDDDDGGGCVVVAPDIGGNSVLPIALGIGILALGFRGRRRRSGCSL